MQMCEISLSSQICSQQSNLNGSFPAVMLLRPFFLFHITQGFEGIPKNSLLTGRKGGRARALVLYNNLEVIRDHFFFFHMCYSKGSSYPVENFPGTHTTNGSG